MAEGRDGRIKFDSVFNQKKKTKKKKDKQGSPIKQIVAITNGELVQLQSLML